MHLPRNPVCTQGREYSQTIPLRNCPPTPTPLHTQHKQERFPITAGLKVLWNGMVLEYWEGKKKKKKELWISPGCEQAAGLWGWKTSISSTGNYKNRKIIKIEYIMSLWRVLFRAAQARRRSRFSVTAALAGALATSSGAAERGSAGNHAELYATLTEVTSATDRWRGDTPTYRIK